MAKMQRFVFVLFILFAGLAIASCDMVGGDTTGDSTGGGGGIEQPGDSTPRGSKVTIVSGEESNIFDVNLQRIQMYTLPADLNNQGTMLVVEYSYALTIGSTIQNVEFKSVIFLPDNTLATLNSGANVSLSYTHDSGAETAADLTADTFFARQGVNSMVSFNQLWVGAIIEGLSRTSSGTMSIKKISSNLFEIDIEAMYSGAGTDTTFEFYFEGNLERFEGVEFRS